MTNTEGVPVYGVTASGIENNYLGTDQGAGGRAALTRLDRDVLSIPGIKTVVVTQGLEDIVAGDHLNLTTDGYSTISNAFGLTSLGPDA
ncbi:hypothetical protein ACFWP7_02265 [Streptomyces sp. NPDC058470]|uniref:hypothetical protein n=1 Tax=Streptomyces sp. NPDC058470 TaxID=3346515 RepID=UPI00364C6D70